MRALRPSGGWRSARGRNVVAVLPDDGYKYLSTNLYSDEEDVALRAQL